MTDYMEQTKSERLLTLYKKLSLKDITAAKQDDIAKINRSEVKKIQDLITFWRLYRPVVRHISMESYIIPVKDGAITGYLFKKKQKDNPLDNNLIIYIHDGGWMLGDMNSCQAICSNICNAIGCAVLAIDYRLAPTYKFPIPIEDCYDAYVWACQGARYWKIDPSRIFIMGVCSGGNIAIGLTRLIRDRKAPLAAGLILEDPITDCRLRTESLAKAQNNPVLNPKQLTYFVQNYQREPKDVLNHLFSPMLASDNSRLPATLIFSSGLSPLKDDAALYYKALKDAEIEAKLLKIADRFHGFVKFPKSERWHDEMMSIGSMLNGRSVINIELLTKEERAKLKRTKSRSMFG